MPRWTIRSLLMLIAGCALLLATWVIMGRPLSGITVSAAASLFFGPLLYGLHTPTPRAWRTRRHELTEPQPLFMGIGILLFAFGILVASFYLFLSFTYRGTHGPWILVLGSVLFSSWMLAYAGAAVARIQAKHLEQNLAKRQDSQV